MDIKQYKSLGIATAQAKTIMAIIEKFNLPEKEVFELSTTVYEKELEKWGTKEHMEQYLSPSE
jgi:hypothetical protein